MKVAKKDKMMKELEDYLNNIIVKFGNTQSVQDFLCEDDQTNIQSSVFQQNAINNSFNADFDLPEQQTLRETVNFTTMFANQRKESEDSNEGQYSLRLFQ